MSKLILEALRPSEGYDFLILEVSRSHTTHLIRYDSAGRVISSHSQQTSKPPAGFEPAILEGERPQT
jgi:YD repeat-containing protein